ncbi:hypothetical protein [Rhodococcus erythropolis]|uniref:hypothetical protein n=1 Tax=Rhodococcus erythropolis TaxID=1833 RepID=UPI001BE6D9F0|nr:hypothetical protein [Rhodococcus erythropolis]MBT2263504.1 hypothetical protein [Rhodococcus erythropolis]
MTLIASDPVIVAKFSRAGKHAVELMRDIHKWIDNEAELDITQSSDLKTAELRLHIAAPPPLTEWSVALGDTVHNLRSALDVWTYKYITSTYSGTSRIEDRDIYFPICKNGSDFRNWKNKTGKYLPNSMISALREAQPYNSDIPLAESAMWLIQEFDNADKHREPLAMDFKSKDLKPFIFSTDSPDFTEDSIRVHATSVSISEGGLMVVLESDYPLHDVNLRKGLELVPFFTFEGNSYQLMDTLREFLPGVQGMLRRLEISGNPNRK